VLTGALDGDELDASLLLLAELGPVAATDLRFVSICNAIARELCRNGRIMRYTNDDGFGAPETPFSYTTSGTLMRSRRLVDEMRRGCCS
jgi:GH15 family glucan-1,4-alpha-glucosidase